MQDTEQIEVNRRFGGFGLSEDDDDAGAGAVPPRRGRGRRTSRSTLVGVFYGHRFSGRGRRTSRSTTG